LRSYILQPLTGGNVTVTRITLMT